MKIFKMIRKISPKYRLQLLLLGSKLLIGLGLLAWLLFVNRPIIPIEWSSNENSSELLLRSFQQSGATFLSENINGWCQLNNTSYSIEKLQSIVCEAADILRLPVLAPPKLTQSAQGRSVWLSVASVDSALTGSITIHQMDHRTILIIDQTFRKVYRDMSQMENEMTTYLTKYHPTPRISHCMSGVIHQKLSSLDQQKLQTTLFAQLQASETESLKQDHFISVSGYTRLLPSLVQSTLRSINVQVALRADANGQKSYLWVGTPVITMEY